MCKTNGFPRKISTKGGFSTSMVDYLIRMQQYGNKIWIFMGSIVYVTLLMAILLDENEAFTKQFMRIQILTTRN
jgi:hypothetical protein